MVNSNSNQKEVIEAQLDSGDLNNLAMGYGPVEIEGDGVIVRVNTENIDAADRAGAIEEAYHHTYKELRRELQD